METVDILDLGSGNIGSLTSALEKINIKPNLCKDNNDFRNNKLIIPGVGSFSSFMKKLKSKNIDKYLTEFINKNKSLLGICVGFQVLFESSTEDKFTEGLKFFAGNLDKIKTNLAVPHVGWNSCKFNKNSKLFDDISDNVDFYFTHSFIVNNYEKKDIITFTNYETSFPSSVSKNNIYGLQFHPEKSQFSGLKILKNFVNNC
tara:strand:+ start:1431 stop:2036 length:606 start_codon:yes stop_codon:yes gene_type:complete